MGNKRYRGKRRYGWRPEKPDHRDYIYKPTFKLFFPRMVDLRPLCSPVEDQGSLGSCTGNASGGAMEYLDAKDGEGYVDVSRLMIYYDGRIPAGTVNEDTGAYIRDVIKGLAKYGVCSEMLWPYEVTRFAIRPAEQCYTDALSRRITVYQKLRNSADIINCLAGGYPVIIGITVYPSFESIEVARTGIVQMPAKDEAPLGGHAVLVVGYDMNVRRFIVRNSWGPGWGKNGYFTLPFEYVDKMGNDFWTIKK